MINRALHILTNKKGPFEFVDAAYDPFFVPKKLNRDQQKLRQQLYLDKHECYAEMLICALRAYPDIYADIASDYDPCRIPPTGVTVEGAEFLVDKNLFGHFTGDQSFPFDFTYTILLTSNTTLTIRAKESGKYANTTYQASGYDPNKIIHIAWPAAFPFAGPMRLHQPQAVNGTITINVRPFAAPYASMVKRIAGNTYLGEQLGKIGLLEEFHASEDSAEKVAIAAAVILNDY